MSQAMTSTRDIHLFADNFVKSPKLFNLKLNSVQNITKSLSNFQPISRNDEEIEGIQPHTYRQFESLESNSSVPFWVHQRNEITNTLRSKQIFGKNIYIFVH